MQDVVDAGGVPAIGRLNQMDGGGKIELVQPPLDIMQWLGISALAVEL